MKKIDKYKIFEESTNLSQDFQLLKDVFEGVYEINENFEFDVTYENKNHVTVAIRGKKDEILSLRKNDIFFRVERLTDYRLDNAVDLLRTFRDIKHIEDNNRVFSLIIVYHWMRTNFMDKGVTFEPRDISWLDKMEIEFKKIRKQYGIDDDIG